MKKEGAEYDLGDIIRNMVEQSFENTQDGPVERLDEPTAKLAAELFIRAVTTALAIDGRVEINRLGVLALDKREADNGTLPDGTPWETPERLKIVLRPAPALKRTVSEVQEMPVY